MGDEKRFWSVGDIVRVRLRDDGKPSRYRVWRVVAVNLGGENEEDLAGLQSMDLDCPGPIRVPLDLLDLAERVE